MSEKDFDKGYKSGFKFGKEVANEEWLNKVKQAINEVSKLRLESGVKGNIIDDEIYIDSMDVLNILDKLIAESE